MAKLLALWRGDLPLGDALWTWMVFGGFLVNISTSIACFALIMVDLPWVALIVGYGLSVPYNVVAMVGVWKSAARHDVPQSQANLARVVSLALMVVLSLT